MLRVVRSDSEIEMRLATVLFFLTVIPLANAEVRHSTAAGFESHHRLILATTPERAYAALVDDVGLWWDATHSYGGDAAGFSIDDSAGGCFCEKGDGLAVEHMRVVNAKPGHYLVMRGGLGPLQGMAVTGSMRFEFKPHAQGTELIYSYRVGGYYPGGLTALADPVDQVQLGQLLRLQKHIAER